MDSKSAARSSSVKPFFFSLKTMLLLQYFPHYQAVVKRLNIGNDKPGTGARAGCCGLNIEFKMYASSRLEMGSVLKTCGFLFSSSRDPGPVRPRYLNMANCTISIAAKKARTPMTMRRSISHSFMVGGLFVVGGVGLKLWLAVLLCVLDISAM